MNRVMGAFTVFIIVMVAMISGMISYRLGVNSGFVRGKIEGHSDASWFLGGESIKCGTPYSTVREIQDPEMVGKERAVCHGMFLTYQAYRKEFPYGK